MADPLSPLTGAKPVPLHVAFGGFHLTLAGFDRPFDLLEALGGPLRAAADAAGPGQPPMINEAAFRVAAEAAFGAALSVVVIGTRALLQPLPYRLQMPEDFPALPPDMMPEAAPPDPAPGAAEKTLASAIAEALAVPWPEGAPAPSPDPIADAAPEADTLAEAGPARPRPGFTRGAGTGARVGTRCGAGAFGRRRGRRGARAIPGSDRRCGPRGRHLGRGRAGAGPRPGFTRGAGTGARIGTRCGAGAFGRRRGRRGAGAIPGPGSSGSPRSGAQSGDLSRLVFGRGAGMGSRPGTR
jgi:hypothetical protein